MSPVRPMIVASVVFLMLQSGAQANGLPLNTALQVVLETHVSGAALSWSNGDKDRGKVIPMKTFKGSTGLWCRTFAIHNTVKRVAPREGTACRVEGRWIVAEGS